MQSQEKSSKPAAQQWARLYSPAGPKIAAFYFLLFADNSCDNCRRFMCCILNICRLDANAVKLATPSSSQQAALHREAGIFEMLWCCKQAAAPDWTIGTATASCQLEPHAVLIWVQLKQLSLLIASGAMHTKQGA